MTRNASNHARLVEGVANQKRLGYRLSEFMALAGISWPSLFRLIQNGDVKVTKLGKIKLISHAKVVRLGLVAEAAA